jgi:hypothetical protein
MIATSIPLFFLTGFGTQTSPMGVFMAFTGLAFGAGV